MVGWLVRAVLVAALAGAAPARAEEVSAFDEALAALSRTRVTNENRIETTSHQLVSPSNADRDLVLSGVCSPGAARVTVSLNDGAVVKTVSPQPDGRWSVTLAAADVAALPDGDIVARATVTADGKTLDAGTLTMRKTSQPAERRAGAEVPPKG